MAVNLNGVDLNGPTGSAGKPQTPADAATSNAGNAQNTPLPSSDVQITGTAATLAELERSLCASSPVSAERVDRISRALASGTYAVQPDKVAAGLTQSELTLSSLPLTEL